jgi:hypothetical protein
MRFLERRSSADGGFSTYVDQFAYGALTTPARGYTAEQWAKMGFDDQRVARRRQYDEDAEEQRQWEAQAREAWEASGQGDLVLDESGARQ